MLSFRAKEGSIPGQQEIVGVIPKEFPIEIIVTQNPKTPKPLYDLPRIYN